MPSQVFSAYFKQKYSPSQDLPLGLKYAKVAQGYVDFSALNYAKTIGSFSGPLQIQLSNDTRLPDIRVKALKNCASIVNVLLCLLSHVKDWAVFARAQNVLDTDA
jgi:hypothetical protein